MTEQLTRNSSESSDEVDMKKVPSNITDDFASIECDSAHEGRQLVHCILPINIETLFGLLFHKSKFFSDFHRNRKTTDLIQGSWEVQPDGTKKRVISLNVAISNAIAVGPKSAFVTETQIMRKCSKDGILYSIDATSANKNIPYADSFHVQLHYCMKKTVDDSTFMSVHAQVIFKKNVWGVIKGFIEKNTWVGCEEFYDSLKDALVAEIMPKAKSKGRKRKSTVKVYSTSRSIDAHPSSKERETVKAVQVSRKFVDYHRRPESAPKSVQHESIPRKFLWGIVSILFLLFAINMAYSYKLWSIEKIESPLIDFTNPPSSEDMYKILLAQEKQLKSWRSAVESAIVLLKKTEKELEKVYEFASSRKNSHSSTIPS